MTVLFFDGLNPYNSIAHTRRFWEAVQNPTYQATGGRFGGGAFRFEQAGSNQAWASICPPLALTSFIWSSSVSYNTSVVTRPVLTVRDGSASTEASVQLRTRVNASCKLELLRGPGTVIATSTLNFPKDTYVRVELKATIANAGGTAIVRVNGIEYINFTGDTQETGNNTVDFFTLEGIHGTEVGGFIFHDDPVLQDLLGSAPWNDFLGDVRIDELYPDGDTAQLDFTPVGAGSTNADRVDDGSAGPDDDTTYVHSVTAGHIDRYTHDNLPLTPEVIFAVQGILVAKKDSAGPRTMRQSFKSGATVQAGTTFGPTSDYLNYPHILETDPDTAVSWTESGVNALEMGPEIVT